MLIGKPGPAEDGDLHGRCGTSVEVRGRDLCRDLMGHVGFTEFFFFLVTGQKPTRAAALLPRPPAGRHRRARPDADRAGGADDAGGRPGQSCRARSRPASSAAARSCSARRSSAREILVEAAARVDAGAQPDDAARADRPRGPGARRGKMPGFGHPIHHPVDPRAERILALADARAASRAAMSTLPGGCRGAVAPRPGASRCR